MAKTLVLHAQPQQPTTSNHNNLKEVLDTIAWDTTAPFEFIQPQMWTPTVYEGYSVCIIGDELAAYNPDGLYINNVASLFRYESFGQYAAAINSIWKEEAHKGADKSITAEEAKALEFNRIVGDVAIVQFSNDTEELLDLDQDIINHFTVLWNAMIADLAGFPSSEGHIDRLAKSVVDSIESVQGQINAEQRTV